MNSMVSLIIVSSQLFIYIFCLHFVCLQISDHNNSNNEAETSGLGTTEEASRSSSPFGDINIGTTFSITDGQALEDLAATADDILPDEMPLEGLSIPQEVFDNFLEASASDVDHFPFHQDNPNHPF